MTATLRYNFNTIFDYDPKNGILIPKFNVEVNNTRLPKGVAINQRTSTGGLNLFNYIGRAMSGVWDDTEKVLFIEGFF